MAKNTAKKKLPKRQLQKVKGGFLASSGGTINIKGGKTLSARRRQGGKR